jgi:hypothetical protein
VPPVRTVTKRTVHENDVELVRHDATSRWPTVTAAPAEIAGHRAGER